MAADRFEFGDGEVVKNLSGAGWVRVDDARKWIELAQRGEEKFREARERAQVVCRRAMATYGDLGAVHAAAILRELALLDEPPSAETASNLQPEAAAEPECWCGLVDNEAWRNPRCPKHGDASEWWKAAEAANPFPEQAAVSMQQRRNIRIGEQDLHALLDLGESEQIRSAHVTPEPFAVFVSVIGPDWEPIPHDSEAPILPLTAKRLFHACVAGNETGECVLADGHEKHENGDVGRVPMFCHIDRWGTAWGVAAGD